MTAERARTLRNRSTDMERRLWFALRQMKNLGAHFRRQPPMGKYFPDFACHRAKLIVELDGSQHGEEKWQAHDAARTAFLESRGYHVQRFWNADLIENFDGVVDYILAKALERIAQFHAPHPTLRASTSPRREVKRKL